MPCPSSSPVRGHRVQGVAGLAVRSFRKKSTPPGPVARRLAVAWDRVRHDGRGDRHQHTRRPTRGRSRSAVLFEPALDRTAAGQKQLIVPGLLPLPSAQDNRTGGRLVADVESHLTAGCDLVARRRRAVKIFREGSANWPSFNTATLLPYELRVQDSEFFADGREGR